MASLIGETDRRAIEASVRAHEFVRRAPPAMRATRGHREWLHFYLHGDGLQLFINLSVFDDLRPAAPTPERVRVLVFARVDGVWDGGIDEASTHHVRGGQLASSYGDVHLDFIAGRFHLHGALRDRPISFDLSFEPRSFPSLASDVRVGDGDIHWLVVPQLVARGEATISGRTHHIAGALAYHDHNWGTFAHRDFRWQWGHAASADTAIVLARLVDRTDSTAFLQSLFVWTGPRIARIFRGDSISLSPLGFLRRRSLTLPRLASLLAIGATEVPERIHIEAHDGPDRLAGELRFDDAACIVLGEGAETSSTLLYEVVGHLSLAGTIGDRPLTLDAPLVFEMMRSA